jgi:hypothetical protein
MLSGIQPRKVTIASNNRFVQFGSENTGKIAEQLNQYPGKPRTPIPLGSTLSPNRAGGLMPKRPFLTVRGPDTSTLAGGNLKILPLTPQTETYA